MLAVERIGATDRQADAVNRQRIVGANSMQEMMRRTAGAHVILGVDLEEIDPAGTGENVVCVLVLEPHACRMMRLGLRKRWLYGRSHDFLPRFGGSRRRPPASARHILKARCIVVRCLAGPSRFRGDERLREALSIKANLLRPAV